MSSKIQGYGPQAPVVTGGAKNAPVERTSGGEQKVPTVTPPARDSVTLTSSGRQLQKLAEAVAAAPATSADRVAAVKQALAQGTYEVDVERVADRLLAADRELTGR